MTRFAGCVLFLPVPLVLWLFNAAPLGPVASIALGVAVMLSHRAYARPWAQGHAPTRCLWCGGAAGEARAVTVADPLGTVAWHACSAAHEDRLRRVLGWAQTHARFLQVGILCTVAVFVVASLVLGSGFAGRPRHPDLVAFFRLGIALTVLPFGVLAPRGAPRAGDLRAPLPVHIQALIGTALVLWLFRLVGLAWLVLGAGHLAGR